jgi:hypothetical protein
MPEDLWVATMAHCSSMGEAIRRVNYRDLVKFAAHCFCWICSYVNCCRSAQADPLFAWNEILCDIVYFKFPGVCGHCRENPCKCKSENMDAREDKSVGYGALLQKWEVPSGRNDFTLSNWLQMFRDIFGGRIHMSMLESIGFHFLEEAGEEALAVRKLVQLRGVLGAGIEGVDEDFVKSLRTVPGVVQAYMQVDIPKDDKGKWLIDFKSRDPSQVKARLVDAKMGFVIELADTFSWFCAILIKLKQILDSSKLYVEDFDIEAYLQKEYSSSGKGLLCPTCKANPCACQFFHEVQGGFHAEKA